MLQLQNSTSSIELNTNKIASIDEDIEYYNANIEAYENLESLRRDLVAITKTVDIKKDEIKKVMIKFWSICLKKVCY